MLTTEHQHLHVCLCSLDRNRRRAAWRWFGKFCQGAIDHEGHLDLTRINLPSEFNQELQDATAYLAMLLEQIDELKRTEA